MSFKNIKRKGVVLAKEQWPFEEKRKVNSQGKINEKKIVNGFRDIKNKKWKVFRVSPIYNFTNNNLKFYEKKLDEKMNSNKHEISGMCYRSKLSINKNFTLNDQCFEVLQVELIKNETQIAYLGLFILWNDTEPRSDGSIFLPVLLVEAKAHERHRVHFFLCKIFDCDIQPVTFSFYALIYCFVKLMEIERNTVDVSQEQVTMEFKIPGCEVNDNVKISLNLEDIIVVFAMVMESLHEKYQKITVMGIIWEFYNKILNHFHQIFKMDLIYAELQKITFPDAFLTADGQIKISSDDAAIAVLNVLKCFTPLEAIMFTFFHKFAWLSFSRKRIPVQK